MEPGLGLQQVRPDGSKGQEFSLALRISDGNVLSFANLDIQVLDENDNAPNFLRTDSSIDVQEAAPFWPIRTP